MKIRTIRNLPVKQENIVGVLGNVNELFEVVFDTPFDLDVVGDFAESIYRRAGHKDIQVIPPQRVRTGRNASQILQIAEHLHDPENAGIMIFNASALHSEIGSKSPRYFFENRDPDLKLEQYLQKYVSENYETKPERLAGLKARLDEVKEGAAKTDQG